MICHLFGEFGRRDGSDILSGHLMITLWTFCPVLAFDGRYSHLLPEVTPRNYRNLCIIAAAVPRDADCWYAPEQQLRVDTGVSVCGAVDFARRPPPTYSDVMYADINTSHGADTSYVMRSVRCPFNRQIAAFIPAHTPSRDVTVAIRSVQSRGVNTRRRRRIYFSHKNQT